MDDPDYYYNKKKHGNAYNDTYGNKNIENKYKRAKKRMLE